METSPEDSIRLVKDSALYKEFLAEHQEILCHKWIESEKVGYDIGFERALFDWLVKYRSAWLDEQRRLLLAHSDKIRPFAWSSETSPRSGQSQAFR
jgi:hypothetical protein